MLQNKNIFKASETMLFEAVRRLLHVVFVVVVITMSFEKNGALADNNAKAAVGVCGTNWCNSSNASLWVYGWHVKHFNYY